MLSRGIFSSLLGSRVQYGNVVYKPAIEVVLKMPDPLTHFSRRLVTGSFRTIPVHDDDV